MLATVTDKGQVTVPKEIRDRTGIAPGRDVETVERAIEDHIPVEFQHHAHHWLILHGRYVCKARNPQCGQCGVSAYCAYASKALAA